MTKFASSVFYVHYMTNHVVWSTSILVLHWWCGHSTQKLLVRSNDNLVLIKLSQILFRTRYSKISQIRIPGTSLGGSKAHCSFDMYNWQYVFDHWVLGVLFDPYCYVLFINTCTFVTYSWKNLYRVISWSKMDVDQTTWLKIKKLDILKKNIPKFRMG